MCHNEEPENSNKDPEQPKKKKNTPLFMAKISSLLILTPILKKTTPRCHDMSPLNVCHEGVWMQDGNSLRLTGVPWQPPLACRAEHV